MAARRSSKAFSTSVGCGSRKPCLSTRGRGASDTWQCNWKVAVDNNLENYHVPIGHPGYHRLLDSDLGGILRFCIRNALERGSRCVKPA